MKYVPIGYFGKICLRTVQRMRERRKAVIRRTVFAVIMIIAAAALFTANYKRNEEATYSAENSHVEHLSSQSGNPAETAKGIPEPDDAYTLVRLTLGGNCTPASMLGHTIYGTFNAVAEAEGTDYFFSGLRDIFSEDDCTVLGCAAVLSDRELAPAEKKAGEDAEWYLAPGKNAGVFSDCGVEIIGLENTRSDDYGKEGRNDTAEALEKAGLTWSDSGKAAYPVLAGAKIGLLSVSLDEGDDTAGLISWVEKAAESCSYVVVYAERGSAEDAYYDTLGRTLIDAGCSLVCYTGAVPESGTEAVSYGGGVIVNSLGYLLDGAAKYAESDTFLYGVTLTVMGSRVVQAEGELIPVDLSENAWQPKAE